MTVCRSRSAISMVALLAAWAACISCSARSARHRESARVVSRSRTRARDTGGTHHASSRREGVGSSKAHQCRCTHWRQAQPATQAGRGTYSPRECQKCMRSHIAIPQRAQSPPPPPPPWPHGPCVSMVMWEMSSPRVKVEAGVMASEGLRMRVGPLGVRLQGMDRKPRDPSMAVHTHRGAHTRSVGAE
jgi:hypothetical protein